MKAKKILIEILTDWRHYFGWAISTIAVGLFFKYGLGFCLCSEWINVFYLFLVIMGVDVLKHITNLQ